MKNRFYDVKIEKFKTVLLIMLPCLKVSKKYGSFEYRNLSMVKMHVKLMSPTFWDH